MRSYTNNRSDYGIDTKNTSTANLDWGDTQMNSFHRRLLSKRDWPFLHRLRTVNTVGSTTFVNLPYDVDQVESLFVTVGGTRYVPRFAPSRQFWDELHYSTVNSTTPEWAFIYDGQIGLWPTPGSTGNVISLNAKIRVPDLNVADYTTGTVDIITSGSTSIIGSGTVWTAPMVGRWIRVTASNSATASGDGHWYEITGVTSGTQLTIERTYGGNTLATGANASYTIGQMPLLPESAHDLPEIYGAWRYWLKEADTNRATSFKDLLTDGVETLFSTFGVNDLSLVLDDGEDGFMINNNLTINL